MKQRLGLTRTALRRTAAAGFLIVGTLLAGRASIARAQAPAARDTTVADQIIEAIKPSYGTDYNITRQRRDWKQKITFGTRFGAWDLRSDTDFTIGNDSNRDSENRNGSTRGSITWRGMKSLPLTLDFRINRISVNQPSVQTENNTGNITLRGKTTRKWLGVRNTVDLRGGYDKVSTLSATSIKSSESRDSGLKGTFEWKGKWTSLDNVLVNAAFKEERASKRSELEESTADSVRANDTSRRSRNFTMDVTYDPFQWVSSKIAYADRSSNDVFFQVQTGGGDLETKVVENNSVNFNLTLDPTESTTLTWSMSSSDNLQDFRVRTDRATQGNGSDWEGTLHTEILGTDIKTSLSRRRNFTDPRISFANTSLLKVLDAKMTRKLSRKFDGRFTYEQRLRQQFFRADPDQIQDSDELKTKGDFGIDYRPNTRWTVNLGMILETTDRIEVNTIRAGESNTEDNATITVGLRYQLSGATWIRQNYSFQETWTTFRFNQGKNFRNQTQRIVTSMESKLTPRVTISMTHNFNLLDSGPFRVEPDGSRTFLRSSRAFRQDLTSKVDYRVNDWLSFNASEQFLRTDNISEGSDARLIRRNLELRQGFNVKRTLGEGLDIRANGSYVQSSTVDSYWSLTSSLSKDF